MSRCFSAWAAVAVLAVLSLSVRAEERGEQIDRIDVGNPISEKASGITLRGFAKSPETLGDKTCRNTDESGLGDDKMGWGYFEFDTPEPLKKGRGCVVELVVWGKSQDPQPILRDTRSKREDGKDEWTRLRNLSGVVTGKEEWNTLTFWLGTTDYDDSSAKQAIGMGGGDSQIWISEITIKTLR